MQAVLYDMIVNGFKFGKLDFLKLNITHPTDGIPTDYGIYCWVYWPKFDETTITQNDLSDLIKDYTEKDFYIEEKIKGLYKFEGKIWEQGYHKNGNMFGLSDNKNTSLHNFFLIRANIVYFSNFFKELCFTKPFYIGKADSLRKRLSNHFASKSNIIPSIVSKGIPDKDIWVGFKTISAPTSPNLNVIFEEIYTRKVKPGLSIKPN